jgi:hypothetical protein
MLSDFRQQSEFIFFRGIVVRALAASAEDEIAFYKEIDRASEKLPSVNTSNEAAVEAVRKEAKRFYFDCISVENLIRDWPRNPPFADIIVFDRAPFIAVTVFSGVLPDISRYLHAENMQELLGRLYIPPIDTLSSQDLTHAYKSVFGENEERQFNWTGQRCSNFSYIVFKEERP